MANINKSQNMRPCLSDVVDYINAEHLDSVTKDDLDTAIKTVEDTLEQSISDNMADLYEGLTKQPDFENMFTDVISGVTIEVLNGVRIGGLVSFSVNVLTNSSTSVLQGTIIAKPASWFEGRSLATSYKNSVAELTARGLRINTPLTTNTILHFQFVGNIKEGN